MPVPVDPTAPTYFVNEVTVVDGDVLDARFLPLYQTLDPAEIGIDDSNVAPGGLTALSLASAVTTLLVPAGSILATACAAAPTGYLLCDGASVLRATYPALFTAMGSGASPYGLPDGTHFNVPDLRGRVPVGVDGTAARLTANDALGNASGEEKHPLTTGELAAHAHAFSGGQQVPYSSTVFASYLTTESRFPNVGGFALSDSQINSINGTDSAGSGTAHNTMQPYQIVTYVIKT